MTRLEAIKKSIRKWEGIVKNNGIFTKKQKSYYTKYIGRCPLCELYIITKVIKKELETWCKACPLFIEDNNLYPNTPNCAIYIHPYYKWYTNQTSDNAQVILNLLKNALKNEINLKNYWSNQSYNIKYSKKINHDDTTFKT